MMINDRYEFMTTSPELTDSQQQFLNKYLDSLDYGKIDVKKLLREVITTQVLRDPDAPKGGKYDIFCGHNRTLSDLLEPAETTIEGFLRIFHVHTVKRFMEEAS